MSSVPNSFDPQKFVSLLKEPYAGERRASPEDWLYGGIGAAAGILGFVFWVWGVQTGFARSLSGFGNIVIGGMIEFVPPGKFLWIALVSIVVLVGSLTLLGNRFGTRNRSWQEAAALHGGTQLWFGAAYFALGLMALVAWRFSLLLAAAMLLVNLTALAVQAIDMHEVAGPRKFKYVAISVSAYFVITYLVISVL